MRVFVSKPDRTCTRLTNSTRPQCQQADENIVINAKSFPTKLLRICIWYQWSHFYKIQHYPPSVYILSPECDMKVKRKLLPGD